MHRTATRIVRRLQAMQGVQFLAFMSSVILSAVQDVASFSFIMFVIIIIFFAAFAIGGTGNPDLEFNPLTTYALLLGDFDQDVYFSSSLLATMFCTYTFLMVIVLLNIAIGIIGDTLERVQDKKDTLTLQIRADLITTYQRTTAAPNDGSWYPNWLHVALRHDRSGDAEETWLGRVASVKAHIEQVRVNTQHAPPAREPCADRETAPSSRVRCTHSPPDSVERPLHDRYSVERPSAILHAPLRPPL